MALEFLDVLLSAYVFLALQFVGFKKKIALAFTKFYRKFVKLQTKTS